MNFNSRIARSAALIVVLSLTFCALLISDLFPSLRGDFGWRWPYEVPQLGRLIPLVIGLAIYIPVALRLRRGRVLVLWCLVGAVIIPILCLYVTGDPLYQLVTRTFSGLATGAHMAGAEITDLGTTLRDWPQIMLTYLEPGKHSMLSVHIRLSPPGLPIFYYGLDSALASLPALADPLGMMLRPYQCQNYAIMAYSNAQLASAWFGILMPFWAGLLVLPLYRAGGRLAAIWWPLVPAVAMFAPTWNTIYPLLSLGAFLLLKAGLDGSIIQFRPRSILLIVLAGVLVSAATFANISIVPLAGMFGAYTLLVCWQRQHAGGMSGRAAITAALVTGLLFGAGLLSIWAVYYAVSGVAPLTIISAALNQHLDLDRPYLPWVFLHLYDLALFAGFPIILLALSGLGYLRCISLRRWVDPAHIDPLAGSLMLMLVILALSGTARGETGRVWLFFVPFILVVAAKRLDHSDPTVSVTAESASGGKQLSLLAITVAQAAMLVTLAGFLRVMGTELAPPPGAPPGSQEVAAGLTPPATFAGSFTLVGEKAVATANGIDLTLTWQVVRQAAVPYYFSALAIGPDGQPVPPTTTWQPFDTQYPVTCWQPNELVTETRHIPLGVAPPTGDYWISLSAFDVRDGKGVKVERPGAAPDTQIGLGPIPLR